MAEPNDAIERLIQESMPDSIVTHYIAIIEVMEEDGQKLRLSMSDGMTPWLALGMLRGGNRMIEAYDDEEQLLGFLDDDEDEDDDDF